MEVLLMASCIIKYDTIIETLKNFDPFLNINENAGDLYYGFIICLKTAFAFYSIENTMPKLYSLAAVLISNFSAINVCCLIPTYLYVNNLLHVFSFFMPSMLIVGIVTVSYKPCELILDIFVLLCCSYYLIDTYWKDMDKLSALSLLGLYTHWYVNSLASEQFSLSNYLNILMLIFVSFLPVMPNNPKHRPRLLIFYAVLILWVFYKLDEHNSRKQILVSQTKIKNLCMEEQNGLDYEKCGLNVTLESLEETYVVNSLDLKHPDNKNALYSIENLNTHLPEETFTKHTSLIKNECFNQYIICTNLNKNKKFLEISDRESKEWIDFGALSHKDETESVNKNTIDTESRVVMNEKERHESTKDEKTGLVKQEKSNDDQKVKIEDFKTKDEKEQEPELTEVNSTNVKNFVKSQLEADEAGEIAKLKVTEDINEEVVSKPKTIGKVASKFPKMIGIGKLKIMSGVTGTGKISKRHPVMIGTSKFAVKVPKMTGPNKSARKFPELAGFSSAARKFPGVTGPNKGARKSPELAGFSVARKFPGVTGPNKGARKFPEFAGFSVARKFPGVTGLNKGARKLPELAGFSSVARKLPGVTEPNKGARKFPGVTGPTKDARKFPELTGFSSAAQKFPGVTGSSSVAQKFSEMIKINKIAGKQPGEVGDDKNTERPLGMTGVDKVPGKVPETIVKEKVAERLPEVIGTSNIKNQEHGGVETKAVESRRSNKNEINVVAMGDLKEHTVKTNTFESKDKVPVTNEVEGNQFEANIASKVEKHDDKTKTIDHVLQAEN